MAKRGAPTSHALVKHSTSADIEDEAAARALAVHALDHIARLSRRATLDLVVEIGDHLIETFYGGDLDLARSHSPAKPAAMRHLESLAPARDISVGHLRVAVALSLQYHALPASVRDRLSSRQHRALLPVKDARAKAGLARRAVSEKLSGDRISELARQEQGTLRLGRKPLGEIELAVNAARRALVSAALEGALEPAKVRALPPEQRSRIAQHVKTLRERIERISDALERLR